MIVFFWIYHKITYILGFLASSRLWKKTISIILYIIRISFWCLSSLLPLLRKLLKLRYSFYCVRLAPWQTLLAFLTFKHELPISNHLPRAMSHNILTFAVLSNSGKNTLANITDKSCENYSQHQTSWPKIDSCSVHS